jgi:hypothetical protein
MADERGAGLDKKVVRLPDGRQLIYYRFEAEPRPPEPVPVPPSRRRKPKRKA